MEGEPFSSVERHAHFYCTPHKSVQKRKRFKTSNVRSKPSRIQMRSRASGGPSPITRFLLAGRYSSEPGRLVNSCTSLESWLPILDKDVGSMYGGVTQAEREKKKS